MPHALQQPQLQSAPTCHHQQHRHPPHGFANLASNSCPIIGKTRKRNQFDRASEIQNYISTSQHFSCQSPIAPRPPSRPVDNPSFATSLGLRTRIRIRHGFKQQPLQFSDSIAGLKRCSRGRSRATPTTTRQSRGMVDTKTRPTVATHAAIDPNSLHWISSTTSNR